MSWFGWVRVAVVALLSAALVFLAPTLPVQAAPGDITLTGTISSISGAQFREVDVYGPAGWQTVTQNGNAFSVTGPPGEYTVYVYEYDGQQGDWYFSGAIQPVVYTQDSSIQITVPLHTLALDVKHANGSPAPADVRAELLRRHAVRLAVRPELRQPPRQRCVLLPGGEPRSR